MSFEKTVCEGLACEMSGRIIEEMKWIEMDDVACWMNQSLPGATWL
jgi:hypothetical protein